MLGRKKRHTEPAGKREWSDGGQKKLASSSDKPDKIILPMDKHLSMGNCYDEHTKRNPELPKRRKQNEHHKSGIRPYGGSGPEDPENGFQQRTNVAGPLVAAVARRVAPGAAELPALDRPVCGSPRVGQLWSGKGQRASFPVGHDGDCGVHSGSGNPEFPVVPALAQNSARQGRSLGIAAALAWMLVSGRGFGDAFGDDSVKEKPRAFPQRRRTCFLLLAETGQFLHDAGHSFHIPLGQLSQYRFDALDGLLGGGVGAVFIQKQGGQGDAQPVADPLQGVDGGILLAALDHADGVDVQVTIQRQLFLADAFQKAEMPQFCSGFLHHSACVVQSSHLL